MLEKQVYKLLISEAADAGEYRCVAKANGLKVQKSLIVYIAGEGIFMYLCNLVLILYVCYLPEEE